MWQDGLIRVFIIFYDYKNTLKRRSKVKMNMSDKIMKRRTILSFGGSLFPLIGSYMQAFAQTSQEDDKFSWNGMMLLVKKNVDTELVNQLLLLASIIVFGILALVLFVAADRRKKQRIQENIRIRRQKEENKSKPKRTVLKPIRAFPEGEDEEQDDEWDTYQNLKRLQSEQDEDVSSKGGLVESLLNLFKKETSDKNSISKERKFSRNRNVSDSSRAEHLSHSSKPSSTAQRSSSGGRVNNRLQRVLSSSPNEDEYSSSLGERPSTRRNQWQREEEDYISEQRQSPRHQTASVWDDDEDEEIRNRKPISGNKHHLGRSHTDDASHSAPDRETLLRKPLRDRPLREEVERDGPLRSERRQDRSHFTEKKSDLRRNDRRRIEKPQEGQWDEEDETPISRRSSREDFIERSSPRSTSAVKTKDSKQARETESFLSRALNTVKEKAEESGIQIRKSKETQQEAFSGKRLNRRLSHILSDSPIEVEPIKSKIVRDDYGKNQWGKETYQDENFPSEETLDYGDNRHDEEDISNESSHALEEGSSLPHRNVRQEPAENDEPSLLRQKFRREAPQEEDVSMFKREQLHEDDKNQDPFGNYIKKASKTRSGSKNGSHLVYEPVPPKRWNSDVDPEHFKDMSGDNKWKREEIITKKVSKDKGQSSSRLEHVIEFYAARQPKRDAKD